MGQPAAGGRPPRSLDHDAIKWDRIMISSLCLSMIFSENRFPLFRIMLWARPGFGSRLVAPFALETSQGRGCPRSRRNLMAADRL
jgi:hypothetical protein